DLLLAGNGESLSLARDGLTRREDGEVVEGDFLAALDRAWCARRTPREEPRWPFRGGWALFLGYELAAQVEPVLQLPSASGALPVAMALRCPAALLRDHASGECIVVAEAGEDNWIERIVADCEATRAVAPLPAWSAPSALVEESSQRFID